MIHDKYLVLSSLHHTELSREYIESMNHDSLKEILLKSMDLDFRIFKNTRDKIYILKMESSKVGAIQNEFRITLTWGTTIQLGGSNEVKQKDMEWNVTHGEDSSLHEEVQEEGCWSPLWYNRTHQV